MRDQSKALKKEDRIYVEKFDELNGLDKMTLRLVNEKIATVREQSEFKVAKLRELCIQLENELLQAKSNLANIDNLDFDSTMKRLPKQCSDVNIALEFFVTAYSHMKVLLAVQKKFSAELGPKMLGHGIEEFQEQTQLWIANFTD